MTWYSISYHKMFVNNFLEWRFLNGLIVKNVDLFGNSVTAAMNNKGTIWVGVRLMCQGMEMTDEKIPNHRMRLIYLLLRIIIYPPIQGLLNMSIIPIKRTKASKAVTHIQQTSPILPMLESLLVLYFEFDKRISPGMAKISGTTIRSMVATEKAPNISARISEVVACFLGTLIFVFVIIYGSGSLS